MLSTTAEHALRALTYMAGLPEGTAILGRDLAEKAEIPANYLSKILWALGNAGIIDATRGRDGGYRFRKKPSDIRLAEVVELFDKVPSVRNCFLSGRRDCDDHTPCAAHNSWRDVRNCYLTFLETTTVADLGNGNGRK